MYSHHIFGGTDIYYLLMGDLLIAFIAGKIAQRKGLSYYKFFFIGFLLPVIGLVIALLVPGVNEGISEQDKAKALREYKALLDDGTITKAEFDAKKKELMG